MSARPVTFLLHPMWLEAHFTRSVKFQLAIFRMAGGPDDRKPTKMSKTRPKEVTHPQAKIAIVGNLSIPTTLPSNGDKQIDFQLAIDIDGRKSRLSRKISIRTEMGKRDQTQCYDFAQHGVKVFFKSEVQTDSEPPKEGGIQQFKSCKRVKIEDEDEEEQNENQDTSNGMGLRATVASSKAIIEARRDHGFESAKKYKSSKQLPLPQVEDERTSTSELEKLQEVARTWKTRYGTLQEKHDKLKTAHEHSKNKLDQVQVKNKELEKTISKIRKQLIDKEEEERVKLQRKRKQWEFELQMVKEENQELRVDAKRSKQTAVNYQQSTKNIAAGSEAEVKSLRDRVRQLQKSNAEAMREAAFNEQSMNDKDDVISGLKARVLQLDNGREELQCKIKAAQEKDKRHREEFEGEKADLQAEIAELQQLRKTSPRTPRVAKDGKEDEREVKQLKKRVQILEKELQRKEDSIKRLKQSQKSGESSKESQQALKQQLQDLRASMDHIKKAQSETSTSLEARVQMEKIRKEVQWLRRAQKNLLIEKGQLQGANRTLREEIVRNKMSIANILNAIQDTGDEKLISEVYSLTE